MNKDERRCKKNNNMNNDSKRRIKNLNKVSSVKSLISENESMSNLCLNLKSLNKKDSTISLYQLNLEDKHSKRRESVKGNESTKSCTSKFNIKVQTDGNKENLSQNTFFGKVENSKDIKNILQNNLLLMKSKSVKSCSQTTVNSKRESFIHKVGSKPMNNNNTSHLKQRFSDYSLNYQSMVNTSEVSNSNCFSLQKD